MPQIIALPRTAMDDRGWSEVETANVRVVLDSYRSLIDGASPAAVRALYRPDYRDHASTVPGGDLASLVAMVQAMGASSPDTTIELLRVAADGALVMVHSRGKREAGDGWDEIMEIFRVVDELIVEHWEVIEPWDPTKPARKADA